MLSTVESLISQQSVGRNNWNAFVAIGRDEIDKGKYEEAETLLCTALYLAKKCDTRCNPSIAQLYWSLADLYRASGQLADAEVCYRAALKILDTVETIDGIDRAIILKHLSELCRISGNWIEAMRFLHLADKIAASKRTLFEKLFATEQQDCNVRK